MLGYPHSEMATSPSRDKNGKSRDFFDSMCLLGLNTEIQTDNITPRSL